MSLELLARDPGVNQDFLRQMEMYDLKPVTKVKSLPSDWSPDTVSAVSALHYGQTHISGKDAASRLVVRRPLGFWGMNYYLNHPEKMQKAWRGKKVCFDADVMQTVLQETCTLYFQYHPGNWFWYYLPVDRLRDHTFVTACAK